MLVLKGAALLLMTTSAWAGTASRLMGFTGPP